MPDISQYTSATATVILAIAIAVSLFKPLLEAKLLPPTSPTHDTAIRLLAIGVGILIIAVATIASLPPHNVLTPGLAFSAVVSGAKAGIASIVAFHLLTGSYFDAGGTSVILGQPPTPSEPSVTVVPPQKGDAVVVAPAAPASGAWGSPSDTAAPPGKVIITPPVEPAPPQV